MKVWVTKEVEMIQSVIYEVDLTDEELALLNSSGDSRRAMKEKIESVAPEEMSDKELAAEYFKVYDKNPMGDDYIEPIDDRDY